MGVVPVDIRMATVDDYDEVFVAFSRIVAAGEAGAIKLETPQAVGRDPLKDDTLFAVARAAMASSASTAAISA